MTVAIISDLHIGDKSSKLLDNNGEFTPSNPYYNNLKKTIFSFTGNRPLEFLVLAGDIMDFTINSISDSINRSRPFFSRVSSDRISKKIVYIPGNHDKQVWDGLQWDTSIVGNLSDHRPAKPFVHIQPAVITNFRSIELEGVYNKSKHKYGNIFLKGLFENSANNPEMILAYPNLYIRDNDKTILVSHGHMFETAWILVSNLLKGVSGIPGNPGLKELEEWNIPLTSMISTGLGSGGKVSELVYRIERETYEKKTGTLAKTIDSVIPRLKNELGLPWYKKILIPDCLIKRIILWTALKTEDPRMYDDYLNEGRHAEHFRTFFEATQAEIIRLNLPPVKKIILGHTHHPYSADDPHSADNYPGIEFFNTGGWLKENQAEVFLIDKNRFESHPVF